MSFGKTVTSIAIAIQLGLAGGARADSPSITPEMNLLTEALALGGRNLPLDEIRNQMVTDVDRYNAAAPAEGRQERFEQGLIALNLMSVEQAHAFADQAEKAAQSLSQSRFYSAEDAQSALEKQMTSVLSISHGAQFSACDEGALALALAFCVPVPLGVIGYFATGSYAFAYAAPVIMVGGFFTGAYLAGSGDCY